MSEDIRKILQKRDFSREDLIVLLKDADPVNDRLIREKAYEVKTETVGRKVLLRGLIELSNICSKNCLYCGIRAGNFNVNRYILREEEVLAATEFAYKQHFGSIVIQSGERSDLAFTDYINGLLQKIKKQTYGGLAVTLSCGEQKASVYKKWLESGAHRYLLRIEASNPELYHRIHPNDSHHTYEKRLKALRVIQQTGYQTGTGVMIGLPGQKIENLADDLLFFKDIDIDMIGMGPYVPHEKTPLAVDHGMIPSVEDRVRLSLRMISLLRILMPEINIASTTALETLIPDGKKAGILAGANVVMVNLTPQKQRENYLLYKNKAGIYNDEWKDFQGFIKMVDRSGEKVLWDKAGSSRHFLKKTNVLSEILNE